MKKQWKGNSEMGMSNIAYKCFTVHRKTFLITFLGVKFGGRLFF